MYRVTDRLADVTTNVSKAGVERYLRIGAAPAGRMLWVPNGIDVNRFEASPAVRDAVRTALHVSGEFVFLAVGRLERAKGFDVLLQALSIVHTQANNVAVVIAGDGSQRATLEARASALGLGSELVRFLGVRDDVPDLMAASDAFVLPSRWEGLPMVLLEAASSGLPIVASAVGGNAEVVVDQETGFLVAPDDEEALGRAMVRMAELPVDERQRMGMRGRRLVRERYGLNAVVDTWLELYATCARKGQA
jgi:glycosyltransferase involved in cell wall biosynthesis